MIDEIICLAGPTCVGKTSMSLRLARHLNAEIVGADSRQVYKKMDIGTAKPSIQERQRVVHHMIDFLLPDEQFNAGQYEKLAVAVVDDIKARGQTALVVGGTGLYIKALIHGLVNLPAAPSEVRQKLLMEANQANELYERLQAADPVSAARIHRNDTSKIIRALEVFIATGKPISYFQKLHGFHRKRYNAIFLGLTRKRSKLYDMIENRVNIMIEKGFVQEVEALLDEGYDESVSAMNSLGYNHIIAFIRKKLNLDSAIALTVRDTKRYAKRQFTWFNKIDGLVWLDLDEGCVFESIEQLIYERRK